MTARRSPACRRVLAQVSGYLDGEIDPASCEALERHCRSCPECAALVRGLRDAVGLCRQVAAKPLPAAVRRRARASVRRLLGRPARRAASRRKRG
jgi:anti-sigma factor RsiW